ncbi:MAG: preprotein translocase subunit SecE [Armatimonadetes bacterium]|nr:preprotein translocase subunit SecE [Armatimonadota bacterium]
MASIAGNRSQANFFQRVARFFHEVWVELKKTSWPSYDEVKKSTLVVLVAILIITVWIGGLDLVLGWLTKKVGW